MRCDNCGHENEMGSKFCIKCGSTITQENISPEEPKVLKKAEVIPNTIEGKAKEKLGDKNFPLLILALFILQGSFLLKSLMLVMTSKPLPEIFTTIFSLITYIGMIYVLRIYIKKNTNQTEKKGMLAAIASSAGTLLVIWGLFLATGLITNTIYTGVISAASNSTVGGLIVLIGYFLLVFVVQLIFIATIFLQYAVLRFSFDFVKVGRVFKEIMKWFLKKLPKVCLLNLIVTIVLVILFITGDFLAGIIESLQPYGFVQVFLKYLLLSIIFALILQYIFKHAEKMCSENKEKFIAIKKNKTKFIPILPIVAVVLLGLSLIFIPGTVQKGYEYASNDINACVVRGNLLRDSGYMAGAIKEYDSALSRIYSLKAYLSYRKGIITNNTSLKADARTWMIDAKSLDIYNGYVDLFNGYQFLEDLDFNSAFTTFKEAKNNPLFMPETFLGLLETSVLVLDKDTQKNTLDWLAKNEIYNDKFKNLRDAKLTQIDEWLLEIENEISVVEPLMAYKYFEMTLYNEHTNALRGLNPLSVKYPDNSEINYMLTRIYSEYRSEQSYYSNLVDVANQFSDSFEDDSELYLDKESYTAQMYMMANDYVTAESIYRKLYKDYEDDIEIAESFLYLLIKNSKFDEGLALAEELTVKGKTLTLTYRHALCLLNMGKYEESLQIIKTVDEYSAEYSEEYDRLLYAYSLGYANAIKNQEHIDMLETNLGDSILKPYILAMKGWKDKNSDEANIQVDKVLSMDDRLGYVWYAKGINEYEKAVRTSTNDFDAAIESYLRAIKIVPDHVEVYFSLAHCYKKADMKEEALRAFRKVVELLPYQDHRVDSYGMSVHAQGEINTLAAELE